jgi:hypothetical protein
MARFLRLSVLIVLGAGCFAATILAGSAGANARAKNTVSPPQVCCIYIIF